MKHLQKAFAMLLSVVVALGAIFWTGGVVNADVTQTTVTLHYYRFGGDYTGWNLWVWPDGGDGQAVQFTSQDDYGEVATVTLTDNVSKVGFIVRHSVTGNDWESKDVSDNRYVMTTNGQGEAWLLQSDSNVYSSAPSKLAKSYAYIDTDNTITVALDNSITLSGQGDEGFTVTNSAGGAVAVQSVSDASTDKSTDGTTKKVTLTFAQPLNITGCYTVKKENFSDTYTTARNVLDEDTYYYSGNDLGSDYSAAQTGFRLWSPTAQSVSVLVFNSPDATTPSQTSPMQKGEHGTWVDTIGGNLNGKYYQYEVTLFVKGVLTTYQVDDPYSYGASANSGKSLIYDTTATDPTGWGSDTYVTLKNNVDAVVYEAHVRDLTISSTSGVSAANRGKYLGLTETGTKSPDGESTGLDHLIDLGITHVELLPTYDYGTGDETESNTAYDWYNWGYDPVLYDTPEGSYASNPNGTARQNEYKQMVEALHKNNIGVIFDAVFNHTYQTGSSADSVFDKIVPGYYYRTDDTGGYSNGSGCGNDVASEKPMVRKFILDSVKYWVSEYHIDGMRFDLMGLLDKETMQEVYQEAKAINPNFIMYGEGWSLSTETGATLMTQANAAGTGVGTFNDGIRDSVKGTVFDNTVKGFAQGGVVGNIQNFINQIKGQSMGPDNIFLSTPNETVNYATNHDNMDLWDKIAVSNADDSEETRLKMDALTNTIVLTSQGVPLISEGDEFARSKNGNSNSYNDNDANVNPIDWSLKSTNKTLYEYYKGVIAMRKAHPAFRMTTSTDVDSNIKFADVSDAHYVQYTISNNANGDNWKNIFVAYNGGSTDKTVQVAGTWHVVLKGMQAGVQTLETVTGSVTVPAYSALVMYDTDSSQNADTTLEVGSGTTVDQVRDALSNGQKVSVKGSDGSTVLTLTGDASAYISAVPTLSVLTPESAVLAAIEKAVAAGSVNLLAALTLQTNLSEEAVAKGAALTVNVGAAYNGKTVYLYYYADDGTVSQVASAVAENGEAFFAVTHLSTYFVTDAVLQGGSGTSSASSAENTSSVSSAASASNPATGAAGTALPFLVFASSALAGATFLLLRGRKGKSGR